MKWCYYEHYIISEERKSKKRKLADDNEEEEEKEGTSRTIFIIHSSFSNIIPVNTSISDTFLNKNCYYCGLTWCTLSA